VQSFSSHRLGTDEKVANRRAVLLRAKAHNYFRKRASQRRSKVVLGFSPHRLGMGDKAAGRRTVLLRAKAHNYFRKRASQRQQQSSAEHQLAQTRHGREGSESAGDAVTR
jgi:hypothetical protein